MQTLHSKIKSNCCVPIAFEKAKCVPGHLFPSDQNKAVDLPCNMSPPFVWRHQLTVQVPAPEEDKDALATMEQKFLDPFKNLSHSDRTLVLIPFKCNDIGTCPPIENWKDSPASFLSLKIHWNKLQPKPKGGDVHISVSLGHTKTFNAILEESNFISLQITLGF